MDHDHRGAGRGKARVVTANRAQLSWDLIDPDGWLAPDHRARLVVGFVETLDLTVLYDKIAAREGAAGRPAADPAVLFALWLLATMDGVGSARALDRLTHQDLAYRWVACGVPVNYHGLADFRVAHADVLDDLLKRQRSGATHGRGDGAAARAESTPRSGGHGVRLRRRYRGAGRSPRGAHRRLHQSAERSHRRRAIDTSEATAGARVRAADHQRLAAQNDDTPGGGDHEEAGTDRTGQRQLQKPRLRHGGGARTDQSASRCAVACARPQPRNGAASESTPHGGGMTPIASPIVAGHPDPYRDRFASSEAGVAWWVRRGLRLEAPSGWSVARASRWIGAWPLVGPSPSGEPVVG